MKKKRKFKEIRLILLKNIKTQKTINELAKSSHVNWKTTELHLTYLVGKGYAKEIFSSPYARIYEITEKGKEALKQHD